MKSNKGCMRAIVYWALWIVFVCLYMYFDNIEAYRNSEKVKGEVIDVFMGKAYRTSYHYPQIKFIYEGNEYEFAQRSGGRIGIPTIGDKVTVIFPKGQPSDAEQYSFLSYWFSLTALFFSFMIALFFFTVPIFLRYYSDFKKQYSRKV